MSLQESTSKPRAELIGADGNVFSLVGIASRALRNEKLYDQAKEMSDRVLASGSYDEALRIICEYVDPWGSYEDEDDEDAEWDEYWAEMDEDDDEPTWDEIDGEEDDNDF